MATHSDFPQIQRRLRALGFYSQNDYPIDNEWGPGMSAGINSLLAIVEKAQGVEPPKPPMWPLLPTAYAWLRDEPYLPRHLIEALNLYGTKEIAGTANSPIIMGWAKELADAGHPVAGYSADSVPWCGLFMAVVMLRAKRPIVPQPLWALNWSKWEQDGGQPELGDLMTFTRDGGGHVAQYIGEDAAGYYHILGANQKDQVNIMRIEKKRMHACRQPAYQAKPANVRPIILASGGQISRNEA
jgi:uncharacterized protein (TIGR02594 family)